MKSQLININDSKLSDLESEEGIFDINDNNISTYIAMLNKSSKLKKNNGFPADFFIKDPILDIGYIISEPLWILNSLNYSPYGYIQINDEHQNLINNSKFCGFILKNNFFIMTYNQNNLYLYNCNYINKSANIKKSNYLFNIALNSENEENIINVQFLPNDLGKAYFIIVTDIYNSYLLNLNINNNNTSNINYNIEKIKDKYSQSILAKSFSAIWPFNYSNKTNNIKISNCFIISPHRQLKKKNNIYTYYNTLFLLSNDTLTLKYISFSINNNSILPVIENSKDLYKDIMVHFSEIKMNFNPSNVDICSVDSFFDEKKKILFIYCFLGINDYDEKYILKIIVDNNFNVSFSTINVTDKIEKNNVQNFKNSKIFVNNYFDEGILVIPGDVIINFNYCNINKNKNINGWKSSFNFKNNILGINKFNQYGIFNLDLFTIDKGIININPCLCYNSPDDVHGKYTIEKNDHTNLFLSSFLQGQNINKDNSSINNVQNININNSSLNNSFQSNSSQKKRAINLKPYEIILNKEKKKEFHIFLDEIIKKYLLKNSYINELNEKDEYIITKFNSFFNADISLNRDKNEIINDFLEYIYNIVNDEKTHIEIMEKSRKKLKLLTVQYLQEKYNQLMTLYQIAKKGNINGVKFFEYYPDLLHEFFKIFEKLIIGINISKQENILFEKSEKNGNYNADNIDMINLFLDNFYSKLKEKNINDNNNFNYMDLFGKIDNINEELLNIFFETFFYIYNNDKTNMNNINNFYIQKDNLILFIVNIILEINENIQKLISELNMNEKNEKNNLIKYSNGLWFLSNNNYICNKYLLQIFKNITTWKSQIYKESKLDNDIIFLYAEQLHFLSKNYLIIGNNSLKNKLDFINIQKIIDGILSYYDIDRTYKLCQIYFDDYTLAKIAFNNKEKYYNDLKIFMKKELAKKKGHIKYILQLILEFEIDFINKCKDDNNIEFNYFEEFIAFEKEIFEIIKISKKAKYFFNLYLLQKNIKNNVEDNLYEKIVKDMKNEAKLKWNDNDNNNINYFTKLLSLNKCLNLIKNENKASIINNNDYEEDNIDNNMIID